MHWSRWLCGAALVAACVAAEAPGLAAEATPAPVEAQPRTEVSLAYFMDRLSLFGRWLHHPKWGDVWQPDAGADFRPYFYGYWQDTQEYGWFWVSNEPYGDIVYHYGRWVFDPKDGWLWVPGYVWGPSWVVWRESDTDIGWLPMPPGYADFDQSGGIALPPGNDTYGYDAFYGSNFVDTTYYDLWVFVGNEDFGVSRRRRYKTGHEGRDRVRHSRDRTHYRDDHDHVVDRSIDPEALSRATHREFRPEPAERFMRRGTPITAISEAKNIFRREREHASSAPAGGTNGSAQGSGRAAGVDPAHGRKGAQPFDPDRARTNLGDLNFRGADHRPFNGRIDRPEAAQAAQTHPALVDRPFSRFRGGGFERRPAPHEPPDGASASIIPHTDHAPNQPTPPGGFHSGAQPAGLRGSRVMPFGAGMVHAPSVPPPPAPPISPANAPQIAPQPAIPQAPAAQFAPPQAARPPAGPNPSAARHRGF